MSRIAHPGPDAPTSEWLVYGDLLQEAGDPRGELVALSHAVDEGRTEPSVRDAYVATHAEALLGVAHAYRANLELRFRYCDVVGVCVKLRPLEAVEPVFETLFAAPTLAARFDLEVVADPTHARGIALAPAIAQIAAHKHRVRALAIVDAQAERSAMLSARDFEPNPNLVQLGTLAALWPSPLEALHLVVADSHQLELGAIDAPELRAFSIACLRYGDGYTGGPAPLSDPLARARWPKLEDFALRIPETYMANTVHEVDPYVRIYSAEDYEGDDDGDDGDLDGVDWAELDGLLANLAKCAHLRRVALTSFETGGSLMPAIERAGLAPTVRELDLSDSGLGDAEANWIVARRGVFANLTRLVLERTRVTDDTLPKLRALGFEVVHSEGTGARYRYVVGQE